MFSKLNANDDPIDRSTGKWGKPVDLEQSRSTYACYLFRQQSEACPFEFSPPVQFAITSIIIRYSTFRVSASAGLQCELRDLSRIISSLAPFEFPRERSHRTSLISTLRENSRVNKPSSSRVHLLAIFLPRSFARSDSELATIINTASRNRFYPEADAILARPRRSSFLFSHAAPPRSLLHALTLLPPRRDACNRYPR